MPMGVVLHGITLAISLGFSPGTNGRSVFTKFTTKCSVFSDPKTTIMKIFSMYKLLVQSMQYLLMTGIPINIE
jgi:hypothetical protein